MIHYNIAKEDYRIKISDHILDNIYGHIGLTEVEKKIERLSVFKRLHSLSQLGMVNWIFPCALHNRYIHSLGVMYIAGEMSSRINTNMGETFFCDSEIQILRLTGLLHDIGHYPLSHNIEFAYREAQKYDEYMYDPISKHLDHFVNCPNFLNPNKEVIAISDSEKIKDEKLNSESQFFKDFSGTQNLHHENIGNLIITHNEEIRKIIKNNFVLLKTEQGIYLNRFFVPEKGENETAEQVSEEDVDKIVNDLLIMIGNLVIGNYAYEKDREYLWMEKYSAMLQLIHSDLDADNLDYLLRDATFSGTSYGLMDMGVLLNCLYVSKIRYQYENEEKDGYKYIVGVIKKGIGPVEQFLLGKFMAYSQMIYSKYVSALEAMILNIESEFIIPDDKNYSPEKIKEMVKKPKTDLKYLEFTDHYLYEKLFSLAENINMYRSLPRAILSRLWNSCSFDLDKDCSNNEFVSVGIDEEIILSEFKKSELYNCFINDYNSLKNEIGSKIKDDDENAMRLFSYRFEQYRLTKQIPIDEFEDKFKYSQMSRDRRFNVHYYRLANGIPILESEKIYSYTEIDIGKPERENIPQLCIDSHMSAMKDLRKLQFVALRKYSIKEA